ncbi:MAG: tetratricopeptide repeat protein [Burkholderiales bacterium]
MSVINQVLLNLEKRRASAAERGVLPNHVQALPEGGRVPHWGWLTAGGAVAVAALAAGWMSLTATDTEPPRPPAPRSGTEGVIERVVAASAGVTPATRPDEPGEAYLQELRAFRLSLELSNPPAEPTRHGDAEASQAAAGGEEPLRSGRLIGRMGAESATDATTAGAAAPARSEVGKRAAAAPVKPAADAASTPEIRKQMRDPTPSELADNEYRKAVALLNQGRLAEAEEGFRAALSLYPELHQARQGLIGLLLQGRKLEEGERVLEEGVKLAPAQIGFNMTLARLQADRGDNAQATATLQRGLEHAKGSADYIAFLAALLQRQGRHEEAIELFQVALQLRPGSGVWWLGIGISLQAANRSADAQAAYRQARATGNLQPDLAALAEQRLRQLQ